MLQHHNIVNAPASLEKLLAPKTLSGKIKRIFMTKPEKTMNIQDIHAYLWEEYKTTGTVNTVIKALHYLTARGVTLRVRHGVYVLNLRYYR